MFHLGFRFRHDCPFNEFSRRLPEATIAGWCNFATDVVEVEVPTLARERLEKELPRLQRQGYRIARRFAEGASATLHRTCPHRATGTVEEAVERHGGLPMQPVLAREGWEHYRVVVLDEGAVEPMVKRLRTLGEVDIVRKVRAAETSLAESMLVSAADLLGELTAKQATALLAAVEGGYYHVPRRVRFEDLAKRRKVPRTTFEEHVRKGESKVINALAPYLALRLGKGG